MSDASLSARAVIRALYRSLLLREPDPNGLDGYVNYLSEGGDIQTAIQDLMRSWEFQSRAPDIVRAYATPIRQLSDEATATIEAETPDVATLLGRLAAHPTWAGEDVLGAMDQPTPKLDNVRAFQLSDTETQAALRERGVHVEAHRGPFGNWLLIDSSVNVAGLTLNLHASRGNLIALGAGCALHGQIEIQGDGNLVVLGGDPHHVQDYELHVHGDGNVFIFGDRSSCAGASFHMEGPERHMIVGRGCMLSGGLYITGTDNHAILDQSTGEVLNPPENLLIGPSAWIGHGAMVLKGAHVGRGAVVAARALVTAPVADYSLAAGAPARVMRTGVEWKRAMASELA